MKQTLNREGQQKQTFSLEEKNLINKYLEKIANWKEKRSHKEQKTI